MEPSDVQAEDSRMREICQIDSHKKLNNLKFSDNDDIVTMELSKYGRLETVENGVQGQPVVTTRLSYSAYSGCCMQFWLRF